MGGGGGGARLASLTPAQPRRRDRFCVLSCLANHCAQARRVLSEAGALDALVDAAREAQRRERAHEAGGGVSALATSFFAAVAGAAALWKAPAALRALAAQRAAASAARRGAGGGRGAG